MKNENIEMLIDALNAGQMADRISRTKLAPTVEYARVWLDEPQGVVANEGSYEFYFVLNDDGLIVAAVYDMNDLFAPSDLHAFVKEAHRKKGHLSKAMNDVILPYLYQQGRTQQEVTFEDPKNGDYCKRNWGFSITGPTSAKKDLTTFEGYLPLVGQRHKLSREEVSTMKIKLKRARLYLTMVKEQVEMSCGPIDELGLDDLIDKLKVLDERIRSLIQDAHERLES